MNDYKTLLELFYYIEKNYEKPDFVNYRLKNSWKQISTKEFCDNVVNLGLGLQEIGIDKGERIGIISNPSPFWVMSDLAIIFSGCITVPIFRKISPENLKFEIEDSELNIIFIGDENEYEPVKIIGKRIKKIITIGFKKDDPVAITFDEVLERGRKKFYLIKNNSNYFFPIPAENDLFTIIYTSGSTGIPKGVMLTHQNIISQIKSAAIIFNLKMDSDRAISSLPLSHIFERMVMYFYLSKGIPVYFVDDLNNIGALIQDIKPTIMTVVPRLLEKILEKIRSTMQEYNGVKKIFSLIAFNRAETKDINKKSNTIFDWFYKKIAYSKILKSLGGNFRYVISGSAALSVDIGKFFLNIGIPIIEGYGMTEASPVISCNCEEANKLGTVGKPFPGVSIKIAVDGEILAKGPNVMKGYFNNLEETEKAIDADGYLHTGDLGEIDNDGFLRIKGRKKELFKKSTGEYVAPIPIEQSLSKIDFVDYAVVIAENKKFVSALLFPDFQKIKKLKDEQGLSKISDEEYLESNFIREKTQNYIFEMNKHLHHTEEVQKFTIIKKQITIETGELTPTLKIRRNIIEEKFKKEIDAMYLE